MHTVVWTFIQLAALWNTGPAVKHRMSSCCSEGLCLIFALLLHFICLLEHRGNKFKHRNSFGTEGTQADCRFGLRPGNCGPLKYPHQCHQQHFRYSNVLNCFQVLICYNQPTWSCRHTLYTHKVVASWNAMVKYQFGQCFFMKLETPSWCSRGLARSGVERHTACVNVTLLAGDKSSSIFIHNLFWWIVSYTNGTSKKV